jgi:hypothetical protein
VNSTPFKVQVHIDSDPNRGGSNAFAMTPNELLPVNLDVGAHRIVAIATRDTQVGPRNVGRLDRPVNVDLRGAGWEMRFNEGDSGSPRPRRLTVGCGRPPEYRWAAAVFLWSRMVADHRSKGISVANDGLFA